MPPALGRLRHRYRRRRSLGGRLDQGHRLGRDDGKRSSRRGMRYRASRDRARRRHVGIERHETSHHQAADHHKVLQDKHHFPLGPQGPPHSISRGSGRVGSFPRRPCAVLPLRSGRCRQFVRGWRRGNGFEPPSRAVHARALPIELPCRRSDSYLPRPRRSVQNCTPAGTERLAGAFRDGEARSLRGAIRLPFAAEHALPSTAGIHPYRYVTLAYINATAGLRPRRARRLLIRNIYNRIQLAEFSRKNYTRIEGLLVRRDEGPDRLGGLEASDPV
jgi:hypothetical protein